MNIAGISADWGHDPVTGEKVPGGAGWVRLHQPLDALARYGGHRTVVGCGVASGKDGRLVPLGPDQNILMLAPDVVILQRWMNDEAPQAIREARAAGQVVINDVDDWFWGLDRRNRAHYTTDPRTNPAHNRDHYAKAVLAGDLSTVSTPFLAKRVRERIGGRTVMLRNPVDRAAFAVQPVSEERRGLTVGWCGALAWRSGDLETINPLLRDFLTSTRSKFVHHGTFPSDTETAAQRLGLPDRLVGPSRPATSPFDYPTNVAGFDIGIVPLTDVPFNHAKSWIKGLEYAAAGIPFVAQAVPEYVELAREGAGLVAYTQADWSNALHRLTDPAERARLQASGLRAAARHDIRVCWRNWDAVYRALAESAA